jgi:hypothetical protein
MLNLSGLTPLNGGESRRSRSRRPNAGLAAFCAFGAASQMALLYPPGIDELMRRAAEPDLGRPADPGRASGAR